jgi:hypothetical protein
LSLALAGGGFPLRELRREQTSIEDVFATLTTRDHAELFHATEPPVEDAAEAKGADA